MVAFGVSGNTISTTARFYLYRSLERNTKNKDEGPVVSPSPISLIS